MPISIAVNPPVSHKGFVKEGTLLFIAIMQSFHIPAQMAMLVLL